MERYERFRYRQSNKYRREQRSRCLIPYNSGLVRISLVGGKYSGQELEEAVNSFREGTAPARGSGGGRSRA